MAKTDDDDFMVEVSMAKMLDMVTNDDSFDCPACGLEINLNDDGLIAGLITCWGEDHEVSCPNCECDFVVKETVVRKFEVMKEEDDG